MNKRKVLKILKWGALSILFIMLLTSGLILIFKENIKSYALEEVNNHLNKKVHIDYIDLGFWKTFPNISLSFDDVLVYSSFDTVQTSDTAIYVEKMFLRFNLLDFFKGQYTVKRIDVQEAMLNLTTLKDGGINFDFLKPSEDITTTPFSFNLDKINFYNTDFTYHDEQSEQFYSGYFNQLQLKGSFNEEQFVMDAKAGFEIKAIKNQSLVLLENQSATCNIAIKMDQINNVFEIQSADLAINKLPFTIQGKVSKDSLDFFISSKNLSLVDVAKNFTLNELDVVRKIKGKGKVNFELSIAGQSNAPAIDANFNVKDGGLSDKGFKVSKINIDGKYTNGIKAGKEELSVSTLQFFTLNESFDGKISVTDFNQPRIIGAAKGKVDLLPLHRLFGPFGLEELSGNIDLDGSFDVRLNKPEENISDFTINTFKASLGINDVKTRAQGDDRIILVNNGKIKLNNQRAEIEGVDVELNKTKIHLDGDLSNISDYLSHNSNLLVNANISSDVIYIDDLSSKVKKETQETERTWLLPSEINGNVNVSIGKIDYSGHSYSQINGKLAIEKHQLVFSNLEGIVSKTNVNGGLVIKEVDPMILEVETTLTANNIDFKPIFKEWNNFDQSVITASNIKGKANVFLYFKGPFDLYEKDFNKEDFLVLARIKIKDGELKNVESFKEITNSLKTSAAKLLISKSRVKDFEKRLLNLKFDDFENEFTIKKGVMTIPNMTIKSNALDLTLEGTHSFDNEIDYGFNFRFREIKGQKKSEFGDVIDDETGFRVFLRMYGTIDEPQFAWDKEAHQSLKEEKKEQAKEDFKSVLKTGFGINKKDSTIRDIDNSGKKEDVIIMEFEDNKQEEIEPEKEKKGLSKKFDEWRRKKEEEEAPVFEWD